MHKRFLSFISASCMVLLILLPASGEDKSAAPTMEITGKASLMVQPNMVTLFFSVETESRTANEAVRVNAEKTDKVLSFLKKASEKETRIRTSGYALFPVYEKEKTGRTALYRARNTVILESKEMERIGVFIDQAAGAGVSSIANLSFGTDKEEELTKEAAAQALKTAIMDAEALAKAAGLSVRRVVKISYDPREHLPVRALREAIAPVQTPISAGEIQIQASVHVVLELN